MTLLPLFLSLMLALFPSTSPQADFPDTPSGRCARAWLALYADGGLDQVRAFEETFAGAARREQAAPETRLAKLLELREEFGGIAVAGVSAVGRNRLDVRARSERIGPVAFEFRFDEAGALASIAVAVERSRGPAARPIDADARARTVDAAARALRDEYVFPDVGAAMADAIRAALERGDYDAIGDDAALAARLSDDLQAISRDKHLRVRVMPKPAQAEERSLIAPDPSEARRRNWGFRSCEIADGNIGVLRFDVFSPEEEAKRIADSAFAFLARCDALVFDLRRNGGGSPEMIAYLTSYLLEEPTLLNRMLDRTGAVVGEAYTEADIPGRRFAPDLPIFIVTSDDTFSGAEEFTYNLRNLGRATVVGETTGGGAHPVRPVRLDDRFVVIMPHLRAQNPITGTNWEGTGIRPDVEIQADLALDKALELARAATRR